MFYFILLFLRVEPFTYFPFSLGPRSCLGQEFAQVIFKFCDILNQFKFSIFNIQINAKLIIAKIAQNFTIELDDSKTYEAEYISNLRLKNGLFCKLKLGK